VSTDRVRGHHVVVQTATAESVAAVRVAVPIAGVAGAWKPALDQVWAFLRAHRELRPGHNLFLYHHPAVRDEPMNVDFGVQVARPLEPEGQIRCISTPVGDVASTLHVGPYGGLSEAHEAIHSWCAANDREIGAASWEVYGDPHDDPALLETTVRYLLV